MKIKTNLIAIILIIFFGLLMFFKVPQKGLFPVPGDMLVSFYYPWYSGEWQGYNPWTTRKELLSADAVRQIYIWKAFAVETFKAGQVPLWNPYTFSGQPLIANFQSSVFYPLNILYLIMSTRTAWIVLIMIQPVLAGIFCYIFARSLKISKIGSLYSAAAFMFSSYLITWLENGNIAHSYIFLPLSLYACQKFSTGKKLRYITLAILSLSFSIFAGHPQTAIYIYLTFTSFWAYKFFKNKDRGKSFLILSFILITSLLICSVQIFPTIALYRQSPVSLPFSKEIFDEFILPYQNLITFLAPDFFGHPATNNLWSRNYGDFNPYIGVLPFIFAAFAVFSKKRNSFFNYGLVIGSIFLIASVASPISYLIKTFRVPILDSTSSARFMSVTILMLVIFSGFGLDKTISLLKEKKSLKPLIKVMAFVGMIYAALWLITFYFKYSPLVSSGLKQNFAVSQRNLLLPSALYIFLLALLLLPYLLKLKLLKKYYLNLLILVAFLLTIFGGLYFSNKYLPAAPLNYIFPDHKIFTYMQQHAGLYRYQGFGTAYIDRNFPSAYRTYGVEGYDTLRLKRYAELMASSEKGRVPEIYPRSDAILPQISNGYRERLMDLLGVKYLVDKEDDPKTGHDWHYERFNQDHIKGIWQDGKFQIYERETVLPRLFVTDKFVIENKDEEIINKIYDKTFDLKTLLLEEDPGLKIESGDLFTPDVKIVKYSPNELIFQVTTTKNSLFFISDAYDPDWKVNINGQQAKLLRADYAFRAVAIPKGESKIVFTYEPPSFTFGVIASSIALVVLLLTSIVAFYKKSF